MSSLDQCVVVAGETLGIPVVHEDLAVVNDYGVSEMLEHCFFCAQPTRYWHLATNDPCCQECAERHSVSEFNASPTVS
jgi:hypothetical protein